jgi:hypothetical protein
MIRIREFIRTGGGLSESELTTMMRDRMLTAPVAVQRDWLRQVELSLDGYGGELQLSAVQKVRAAVKRLETELGAHVS